jgi:hypothetical protein
LSSTSDLGTADAWRLSKKCSISRDGILS